MEKHIDKLVETIKTLCEKREIEQVHTIISIPADSKNLNKSIDILYRHKNYLKSIFNHWLKKYEIKVIKHNAFYDLSKSGSREPGQRDLEIILSPNGKSYCLTKNPSRTISFE